MKKLWLLVLLSLFFASDLFGATYYVAVGGDDTRSCSTATNPATPKAKPSNAQLCLASGDTLNIGAGTYNDRLFNVIPSGSANQYTRVVGAGAGQTILAPSTTFSNEGVISFNGGLRSYIEITGITTDGTKIQANFTISADNSGDINNFYIHDNEFKNSKCGSDSVGIGGVTDTTFAGNWIHGGGIGCGGTIQWAHALYLGGNVNLSHRWLVERNIIEEANQYGVHVYPSGSGHIIRDNIVRGNSTVFAGAGIILYGTNHQVYNNLIYNNNVLASTNGILNRGPSGTQIFNNTIWNNSGYGIYNDQFGGGLTVRNNIQIDNTLGPGLDLGTGTIADHNIITGTAASHFVNAAAADFNLLSTSTAIDAGVDVGLPFNGPFPDAGALESPIFGTASATVSTNTISVSMVNNPGVVNGVGMRNCTAGNFPIVVDGTSRTTSSCTVVGFNQLNLVFSGAAVTTSATVAYNAGTLSDSFCIGFTPGSASCKNGEVRTFAAQTVTISGGTTAVFTQSRGRLRLLRGSETAAPWNCTENQNCTIQVGGSARVRLKVTIQTAAPPAVGRVLWANEGGAAYFKVGAGPVGAAVNWYGTIGNIGVNHGQRTTRQLTQDFANLAPGQIIRDQAAPAVTDCTIPCELEDEFAVTVSGASGLVVCFQLRKDDGTVLNTYTTTPCMTIVNSRMTKALGGLSQGGGLGQ